MAPSARSARRFHCSAVISYGWVMAGVSWSGAGHGCGVERVACGGTDVLGVEVVALAGGTLGVALDAVERGPELLDLLGELAGFGLVVALDGVVGSLLRGVVEGVLPRVVHVGVLADDLDCGDVSGELVGHGSGPVTLADGLGVGALLPGCLLLGLLEVLVHRLDVPLVALRDSGHRDQLGGEEA